MAIIDLNELALKAIRDTYVSTYGPLDPNLTTNDIDWEICEMIKQHPKLIKDRKEIHAWIVCAGIATPADMMQNAERIADITKPIE